MEVKYMWKQKFRMSTALYIFCRYALVANVVYILTLSDYIVPVSRHCPFVEYDMLIFNAVRLSKNYSYITLSN